jgi:hypothetical protein
VKANRAHVEIAATKAYQLYDLARMTAPTLRPQVRERDRIVEISTLDFLRILEAEQRIQSAEQVFELAEKAGRSPSRVVKLSAHDEVTRTAIQELVRRRDRDAGH